ncbi:MAG: LLM class F420-dependent oxidoreductase [Acidimicrobiia bacterium]
MPPIIPPGEVVFGMQLPIQSQSRLYVAEWETTAGVEELVRVAQAADEAGFFYVAVCDHVAIPERLAAAMGTTWYDAVATLGFVAGLTERVRLLSHVYVVPYRHPMVVAKSFATLDHLSGGRAILGVGAGHVQEEFALLGADFDRRGRVLDERLAIVAEALEREFVDGFGARPRPSQQPRPPIWVGGSSPAAIRRAARWDGWLPQGTPRVEMPAQIALLRAERERLGLPTAPFDLGTVCEPVYVGEPTWDVGRRVISGSPERLAASLREFVVMGVNQLQVRFAARSCDELVDQISAFGAEVAPLVRG